MVKLKEMQKKILILGDGSVGKTSLIRRFVVNKFNDKYIATIGTKITAKDLQVELNGEPIYLKLQVWDILGQKGYRKMYKSSFRGVDGVFMVADITRKETLESLKEYWIPELYNIAGAVPFLVLANKSDLMNHAEFNERELREFTSEYKVPFYLTSAKAGENVNRAFYILGKRMLKRKYAEPMKLMKARLIESERSDLVEILDKVIDDFCREYGSLEDAMPILRKQFGIVNLDVNNPTIGAIRNAVDQLATYETIFKGKKTAETNRTKRLNWIKELN